MPKKYSHIHKYQRAEIGAKGYAIYKCMMPTCTHYLEASLAVGKESQCHGDCNGTVIINQQMVTQEVQKPKCRNCIEERRERLESIREII